MLKVNDNIKILVDNSYIKSYVRNEYRSSLEFYGKYLGTDDRFPDSIVIEPSELKDNKNFFPKIRVIKNKNILDIITLGEESQRIDLDDIEKTKDRKFKVKSSDGKKDYDVVFHVTTNTYSCNCYAGLMNKECRHIKGVKKKIEKEKGE